MKKIILTLMLLGAYITPVNATPFDITGPTAFDVDEYTPTVLDFDVAQTGTIGSLGVRMELTSYWDNIFVSLSHLGTEVVLMDFGNDSDNYNSDSVLDVTFQDGGATLDDSCDDVLCTGTFSPFEDLSAFNGMELSGTWTLTLFENGQWDGDNSELVASSVFGTTVPEPASLALVSLGLLGLAGARRKSKK